MAQVKADLTELNNLIRMLKKNYTLRVGIIGSKAKAQHDKESGKTNAEIGSYHEFGGTSKNGKEQPPRRSFLEDALKYKLNFDNPDMKPFKKIIWMQFFVKNSPEQFYKDLGAKALEAIESAFATNGFGRWKSLSVPLYSKRWDKGLKDYNKLERQMVKGKVPFDIKQLNNFFKEHVINHPILTDTGKLRKSISFKVIKK